MKTIHLFEEGYYFLSNQSVAKSFLFGDRQDCELFQKKLEDQLSQVCHILAFGFTRDEFQLVVRLKTRRELEKYYLNKYDKHPGSFIPESTYIFAQVMANIQSGYAKAFNFKYNRDGALLKGRYHRHLIESEQELDNFIKKVHSLGARCERDVVWTFRRRERGFLLGSGKEDWRSSKMIYEGGKGIGMKGFLDKDKIDLRGHFKKLPEKRISFENEVQKLKNFILFVFNKDLIS